MRLPAGSRASKAKKGSPPFREQQTNRKGRLVPYGVDSFKIVFHDVLLDFINLLVDPDSPTLPVYVLHDGGIRSDRRR
jgi:hypothetical protein